MSWPAHWPQDRPSPVLRGDGVWVTPRGVPICPEHLPEVADIVWSSHGDGRGGWRCRLCRIVQQRDARLRRAGKPVPESDPKPPKITPAHPFDWTRIRLEKEWGVPIDQWTRAQHLMHTRAIYHHLGWGDAALEGPVVANGKRLEQPRVVSSHQGMLARSLRRAG